MRRVRAMRVAVAVRSGQVRAGWTVQLCPKQWRFWCDLWTPIWHRGRGPYLSLGLGPLRVYRGY